MQDFDVLHALREQRVQEGDYIRISYEGHKAEGRVSVLCPKKAELLSDSGERYELFGTSTEEPKVWLRLTQDTVHRILVGDYIRLDYGREGEVYANDVLGLKVNCPDGSYHGLGHSEAVSGRHYFCWANNPAWDEADDRAAMVPGGQPPK